MDSQTANVFNALVGSENQVVSILAFLVVTLAGVVVYQWVHTQKNTVPLWIFQRLIDSVEETLKIQRNTAIIINERLKR